MARDTLVSWQTFALLLLAPPVGLAYLLLFPITVPITLWLYYRGKARAELPPEQPDDRSE